MSGSARNTWLIAVAVVLPAPSFAQANPDTGTRHPAPCAPTRARPANAAQIAKLVQCARETTSSDRVTLLENIAVQSGSTRPYNYYGDHGYYSIDTTSPVLPLRGSLNRYICATIQHKAPGEVMGRTPPVGIA